MCESRTSGSKGIWTFFLFINVYLAALGHAGSLVTGCDIWFPDQGLNPGLLPWEQGLLATGPPGKSPAHAFSRPTSLRILGPTAPSTSSHLLQGEESLFPKSGPLTPLSKASASGNLVLIPSPHPFLLLQPNSGLWTFIALNHFCTTFITFSFPPQLFWCVIYLPIQM